MRDLRTVMSYRLDEGHIARIFSKFAEVDRMGNGSWTASEYYALIQEPRGSIRSPILDFIFFVADSTNIGSVSFEDFLVSATSFCVLSKEEIVQLLFMIVDNNRNGRVEKEELLSLFNLTAGGTPIFPINNQSALEKFKFGTWESIDFDAMAQLCEKFPYISYPLYHTQEMYRKALLGKSFWEQLDLERSQCNQTGMIFKARVPGSRRKEEFLLPGRTTMQEVLEFSQRKTMVSAGKRVASAGSKSAESHTTQERDEQIKCCPLINMIRNPRCMYHVPRDIPSQAPGATRVQMGQQRPELELDSLLLSTFASEPSGASPVVDNSLGVEGVLPASEDQELLLQLVARMKPTRVAGRAATFTDDGSESPSEEDS